MDAAQAAYMGAKIAAAAAALGSMLTILVTWLQNRSAEKRQLLQLSAEREQRKQAFLFETVVGPLVEGKRQALEDLYGLVGRTQFRLPGRTELVPWELSAEEQQHVIQLLPHIGPDDERRVLQWGAESQWGRIDDSGTEGLRHRILQDLREGLRFGGADQVLPDLLAEAFGGATTDGTTAAAPETRQRELWRDLLVVALAPTPLSPATDAAERLLEGMMKYMKDRRRSHATSAEQENAMPEALTTADSQSGEQDDRGRKASA